MSAAQASRLPAPEKCGCFPQQELAKARLRNGVKARLRALGHAGEYHRDLVTGVLVARAGNNHAAAIDPAIVHRRLEGHRHLGPRGKGRGAAEFDAILVDDDRAGGEVQPGLARLDGDLLQRAGIFNASRAHITCLK